MSSLRVPAVHFVGGRVERYFFICSCASDLMFEGRNFWALLNETSRYRMFSAWSGEPDLVGPA